jgi:hypothetical protein
MEFLSAERSTLLICSSHADRDYLEQIRVYVQDVAPVDVWDEARLTASDGREALAQALKAAKLALLLISPETLGPQYLASSAVLALVEAARQEGALLLCVIARPCAFEQTALAAFPTINAPAVPVSAMSQTEREQLWERLAAQARDMLMPGAPDVTVRKKDVYLDVAPGQPERAAGIDWDRELQAAYEAVHGAEGSEGDQEPAPALLAPPAVEALHFLACAPARAAAETWESLLLYTHAASAANDAYRDAMRCAQGWPERRYTTPVPTDHPLARGVELTIVPQGPGLTFNPPRLTYRWLEDWHQAPFRFLANSALAGSTAEAEITLFAGLETLATVRVPLFCAEKATSSPEHLLEDEAAADPSLPGTTCFRCGAENPAGRRFCLICNYDLTPRNVPNLQAPNETWLPFIHARLTLVDSPPKEQHFNLHEHTITTIGRAPGNDIILSDPSISRYHAQLRFEAGRWIIEDKNSSLGTYVNGRRIRWPQPIAHGDQLRLAHTLLLFSIVE